VAGKSEQESSAQMKADRLWVLGQIAREKAERKKYGPKPRERPLAPRPWQDQEVANSDVFMRREQVGRTIRLDVLASAHVPPVAVKCLVCGELMMAKRSSKRTCSAKCRQKLSRAERKLSAPEKVARVKAWDRYYDKCKAIDEAEAKQAAGGE
jgi:predicted nucleic acid-binding Zn ribbon protein